MPSPHRHHRLFLLLGILAASIAAGGPSGAAADDDGDGFSLSPPPPSGRAGESGRSRDGPVAPKLEEGTPPSSAAAGAAASADFAWPFHRGGGGGGNRTDGGGGGNRTDGDGGDKKKEDGSGGDKDKNPPCRNYTSCNACSDASWCHWCDKDAACHTMGSWYGCLSGSSCQPPKPPRPDDGNDTTSGCARHTTCANCTLHSSRACHWCAHDNACHAIGSVYGCVTGVDCYSNDRCKRQEPEPIRQVVFTKIGYAPLLAIFALASVALCCSSLCCCIGTGIKGAYDDLADLAAESPAATAGPPPPPPPPHVTMPSTPTNLRQPLIARQSPAAAAEAEGEESGTPNGDNNNTSDETPANETSALMQSEEGHGSGSGGRRDQDTDDDDDDDDDGYVHLVEGSDYGDDDHFHHRRRRPTRSMDRLYGACVTCYLVTLAGIGLFAFAAVRYYPKIPQYNICNDSYAWKSLIESLTHMKVTADFEILASISNPNHFDVALDMGRGSFTHHGVFVGTYDIPPVVVSAMSITDMMIIAHIQPDKWDALSLTTEYYRGKLVLDVDAQANIRVPAFADFTYEADLKDIVVHVNELSDRHLCACPDWTDARNQTPGILGFLELPQQ